MTDIVGRLRSVGGYFDEAAWENGVSCSEAADTIETLRQRVKAFESLETKRMKDAVTVDDWRRIAEHMEYQWRCCSEGFNARCGELRQRVAELEESEKSWIERGNYWTDEAAKINAELAALKRSQQVAPEQGQSNRYCPVGGNCSDASDCDGSCAPYIGRARGKGF